MNVIITIIRGNIPLNVEITVQYVNKGGLQSRLNNQMPCKISLHPRITPAFTHECLSNNFRKYFTQGVHFKVKVNCIII